jgi:hypothetical protein
MRKIETADDLRVMLAPYYRTNLQKHADQARDALIEIVAADVAPVGSPERRRLALAFAFGYMHPAGETREYAQATWDGLNQALKST